MLDINLDNLLTLPPSFLRHTPELASSPPADHWDDPISFLKPALDDDDPEEHAPLTSDDVPLAIQRPANSTPRRRPQTTVEDASDEEDAPTGWWRARHIGEPRTPERQTAFEADVIEEPPDTDTKFSSPWVARGAETASEVKRRKTIEKSQAKRVRSLAAKAAAREQQLLGAVQANARAELEDKRRTEEAKVRCFNSVLDTLAREGYSWGDFVEWISLPSSGRQAQRWDGLFRTRTQVARILDLWAWKSSPGSRKQVHAWAVQCVGKIVRKEAEAVTESKVLQSRSLSMDDSFLVTFDLSGVHDLIRSLCPSMTAIMQSFSTTTRQEKNNRKVPATAKERGVQEARQERNATRVGASLADLLGERSQNNSLIKHVFALYLYASGAKRQVISVLSKFGVCSSYPTITGSITAEEPPNPILSSAFAANTAGHPTADGDSDTDDLDWEPESDSDTSDLESEADSELDDEELLAAGDIEDVEIEVPEEGRTEQASEPVASEQRQDAIENAIEKDARASRFEAPVSFLSLLRRGAGLLKRVCESCRATTRRVAHHSLCGHVYDNINMMFRIAEQIMGRKDSQENGTCATIFPLFDARPEDMQTSDLLQSIQNAPPLGIQDILHSTEESTLFQHSLEHTFLRELVYRSERFARFRDDVDASLPDKEDRIPLHKTDIYPLPAMHIDESSTAGNAEVMDAIFRELGFDIHDPEFTTLIRPIFGDQLSIARLHTLIANRAGHDTLANSYAYAVFGPGLFHHQMALVHGIIETHFGDTSSASLNPSSLLFYNTLIDHKPIVLSSLPPYRTCRDLILLLLTACAPVVLQEVCGATDLDKYASSVTFEELCKHVSDAFKVICSPHIVSVLRRARADELLQHQQNVPANNADFDPFAEEFTNGDMIFENMALLLRDALILREFTDAIKGGYSGRILRLMKVLALMYRGSGRVKYAHEMLHLIHNLTHVWPKALRDVVLKNWLVNPTGKPDSWVPVDLMQEHNNFWTKTVYKAQGSNASWAWLKMVSPCISLLRKITLQMNARYGARLGCKHHTPERDRDIAAIQDSMRVNGVFKQQPGRVLPGHVKDGEVPNVISAGLKQIHGPLLEYNKMFTTLQKRRRQTPLGPLEASLGDTVVVTLRPPESLPESTTAVPSESPSTAAAATPPAFLSAVNASITAAETDLPEDEDAEGEDDEDEDEDAEGEDDAEYWRHFQFEDEGYEPRMLFAEEEDVPLDITDY